MSNVNFKVRDIIYVDKFKYPDGKIGKGHYFLITHKFFDERNNDMVYQCLMLSSQKKEHFPYNYVIKTDYSYDPQTGLNKPSHVKCDSLYKFSKTYLMIRQFFGKMHKKGQLNDLEMFDNIVKLQTEAIRKKQFQYSMNYK